MLLSQASTSSGVKSVFKRSSSAPLPFTISASGVDNTSTDVYYSLRATHVLQKCRDNNWPCDWSRLSLPPDLNKKCRLRSCFPFCLRKLKVDLLYRIKLPYTTKHHALCHVVLCLPAPCFTPGRALCGAPFSILPRIARCASLYSKNHSVLDPRQQTMCRANEG